MDHAESDGDIIPKSRVNAKAIISRATTAMFPVERSIKMAEVLVTHCLTAVCISTSECLSTIYS